MKDTTGVWSRWSDPVQFTATSPTNSQLLFDHLRVTELMYNPPAATTAERNAGFSDQDFEYLEIHNTGTQPLNLEGVAFKDGVTFPFSGSGFTTLAPARMPCLPPIPPHCKCATARAAHCRHVCGRHAACQRRRTP